MILRKKPKFEIWINDENFEILDSDNKSNSGIFEYELTKNLRLEKK